MPPIDLTGQRFGRLSVIKYVGNFSGMSKWLCKCDCGTYREVFRPSLISGKTLSCGCYWRDVISGHSLEDLSNKKFGKWKVLYRVEDYISPKGHPVPKWMCQCECGNERPVTASTLTTGKSKSCGCSFGGRTKDLTGIKFGNLSPIRVVGKSENRGAIWECVCDCGTIINVLSRSLLSGRTMSCGCRGKESSSAVQIKKYFQEHYGAILEYRIIKNPKTGRYLSYDIFIPDDIFIEINGEQHYKYVPYFFKTPSKFQERIKSDKLKKRYAMEVGTFIEIDLRKFKSTQDIIKHIEKKVIALYVEGYIYIVPNKHSD